MTTCQHHGCTREAVCAIRTTAPKGKGLVNTLYQFPEDAPKGAVRYCIPCGVTLMAGPIRLSDSDDDTVVTVTTS